RTLPHIALFGEKDYQQLCVIQRVVNDLDIGVEIAGVETVREPDGLALSSRNAYLSAAERKTAPLIYKVLQETAEAIRDGASVATALENGKSVLTKAGFKVDYLDLRAEYTLDAMPTYESPARLLVAAWLGTTRLIDNIAVE
ncbi:MAG: pantoate--beta-alanine ligase, partial [Rickettsiales bacterium]|nr:pantoate--beta-alanine ligase [Rickettsiales bacterium]